MAQKVYSSLYVKIDNTTAIDTAIATYIAALSEGQIGVVEAINVVQPIKTGDQAVAVVTMAKYIPEGDEVVLEMATLTDLSQSAATGAITSPFAGTLSKVISIPTGDPGADVELTFDVDGGTACTDTTTLPNGETDPVTTLITDNNTVAVGSVINATSDDGASNTVNAKVFAFVRRA